MNNSGVRKIRVQREKDIFSIRFRETFSDLDIRLGRKGFSAFGLSSLGMRTIPNVAYSVVFLS